MTDYLYTFINKGLKKSIKSYDSPTKAAEAVKKVEKQLNESFKIEVHLKDDGRYIPIIWAYELSQLIHCVYLSRKGFVMVEEQKV
jgi:hypothetical protein